MTNACQWGKAVAVRYLNHSHVLYNGLWKLNIMLQGCHISSMISYLLVHLTLINVYRIFITFCLYVKGMECQSRRKKTVNPTSVLSVYRIIVDSDKMELRLPYDKIEKKLEQR
jgi:hypothetical protein